MTFIVHFNEIFLKGKNQDFFIAKLKENAQRILSPTKLKRIPGGFEIESQEDILPKIKYIFGVANVAQVKKIKADVEVLQKEGLSLAKSHKGETFAVRATRSDKSYSLTSPEVNQQVGGFIHEELGLKVSIKNPDIPVHIDIMPKNQAYLYGQKLPGPGGIPVGSSAGALSLISAGFDSPVASYLMAKRGAKCTFLHFHSYPFTSDQSIQNVKKIVAELAKYQGPSKLLLAPLGEVQKELLAYAPQKFLVILYRRIMFRVAAEIAKKKRIKALVTGDSLGQVASQTIENMATIGATTTLPILRPLVGFDKQEIVDLAGKVGTADISKLPYDDCCSRFVPPHPETKAKLADVEEIEAKLPIDEYTQRVLGAIEEHKS